MCLTITQSTSLPVSNSSTFLRLSVSPSRSICGISSLNPEPDHQKAKSQRFIVEESHSDQNTRELNLKAYTIQRQAHYFFSLFLSHYLHVMYGSYQAHREA